MDISLLLQEGYGQFSEGLHSMTFFDPSFPKCCHITHRGKLCLLVDPRNSLPDKAPDML